MLPIIRARRNQIVPCLRHQVSNLTKNLTNGKHMENKELRKTFYVIMKTKYIHIIRFYS